ncbi:trypsin-like [Linepithema humile]|uniref:trypsin-like n=1 Tax=Linepithema humile TaxID=83485 RepID=UPI00062356CA|nr:PREDICTED: trypsin-like [Linepithema humile]XP_012227739.1 PREDICTED: trypsin-like [Linepithema humile]XP_012227741.1 PREDICTED: trypsin-like [Linepithema humile]
MWITLHLSMFFIFSSLAFSSPKEVPDGLKELDLTKFGLIGRIVNGTKAKSAQFPHQVSLRRSWSNQHFCGGNIISSNLVLTAAHCVFMNGIVIQSWTIVLVGGILKLDENSLTRQERGVEKIKVHPEFNTKTYQNDIAILKLSVPFKFTSELHSAILPAKPFEPYTVCQVSGWGYPSENNRTVSNDLMYVELLTRSTQECRELLVNETDLPEGMMCAGWLEGGKDACQGDSGGGMICNGVLTGIVSVGKGCALPRLPGVYADIFHYIYWIIENKNVVIMEQHKNNEIVFGGNAQTKLPMMNIMAVSIFSALLSIAFSS